MPTGIIINSLAIFLGGVVGTLGGAKIPTAVKDNLNLVFGVCSMAMGIYAIAPMKNMAPVIFAVILGTACGLFLHFGQFINRGATQVQKLLAHFVKVPHTMNQETFAETLVTVLVLFCASGTGIYGSLTEGMSGDATILIAKSILDFFTAAIFAANLGLVVSLVALPQFLIFFILYLGAQSIYPLTTPAMILDFKAAGGILMLATGFRMADIKIFPTADMIPAMILVMPLSWFWVEFVLRLL